LRFTPHCSSMLLYLVLVCKCADHYERSQKNNVKGARIACSNKYLALTCSWQFLRKGSINCRPKFGKSDPAFRPLRPCPCWRRHDNVNIRRCLSLAKNEFKFSVIFLFVFGCHHCEVMTQTFLWPSIRRTTLRRSTSVFTPVIFRNLKHPRRHLRKENVSIRDATYFSHSTMFYKR